MRRRPEIILVSAAFLAALGSLSWFEYLLSRAGRNHAEKENAVSKTVLYQPTSYAIEIVEEEPWSAPSAQRQSREWIYEVFTPPEIFYDAGLGRFSVTPPKTAIPHDHAAPELLANEAVGVELKAVRRGLFRLQLIGFVRTDGGPLGFFENPVTHETFLAKGGRELPALKLVIENVEMRSHPVSLPESMITHQIRAIASVRDRLTGEVITLTTSERCHAAAPEATLGMAGAGGTEREVRQGDVIEVGDSIYEIAAIQLSPPSVTLSWRTQAKVEHRRVLALPNDGPAMLANPIL